MGHGGHDGQSAGGPGGASAPVGRAPVARRAGVGRRRRARAQGRQHGSARRHRFRRRAAHRRPAHPPALPELARVGARRAPNAASPYEPVPRPALPRLPVAPQTRAGRRSALRWALVTLSVLASLLAGLLTLWMIGYETGLVPFLAGLFAAALPVPVYVTLVLWLDRYEPEPPWLLAAAFFWGALVAAFFAILINSLGVAVVSAVADEATGES